MPHAAGHRRSEHGFQESLDRNLHKGRRVEACEMKCWRRCYSEHVSRLPRAGLCSRFCIHTSYFLVQIQKPAVGALPAKGRDRRSVSAHRRIGVRGKRPVWIELVPEELTMARAEDLVDESLPLYGIPFAVKDNIDVAGLPTTAGCPS